MTESYLRDTDLAERYNVSRITIWRWVRTYADMPQPVRLTGGCTRWRLSEIAAWEASRSAANERQGAA